MSNARALQASRALLAADQAGRRGSPLQYTEAVKLESVPAKREALIQVAAKALARDNDPQKAAEEIIEAFFTEPPHTDDTPDVPDVRCQRVPAQDPDPAIGEYSGVKVGPKPSGPDDRREMAELETAAKVLGLAVRMNLVLTEVVDEAAWALRKLVPRMGRDKSARITLNKLADDLDDAVTAAGSMDIGKNNEDQRVFEAAMRAGHDPDRAVRLSHEWDDLKRVNGIRISKADYIDHNLRRPQ